MQPGLTGTSAGLEQGGSAAVGMAAMMAQGAGARGRGGSGGQGTEAGAEVREGGGGGGWPHFHSLVTNKIDQGAASFSFIFIP